MAPPPVQSPTKSNNPPITATSRHFVAINCHPFHDRDRLAPGILAIKQSAEDLLNVTPLDIVFVVFWHDCAVPEGIKKLIDECEIQLVHAPHRSNGLNLNYQIEHAVKNSFDTFFRVDIDDTVVASRFLEQIRAFENDEADLVGAGLLYQTEAGETFETILSENPATRDFLENRYLLHPTLAFNLAAIQAQDLRYKPGRLEDKAFLLDARKAGLRIKNLPILAGSYFVTAAARRGLTIKLRALRLNLAFLAHQRDWKFLPYALLLFLAHSTLGSTMLRKIRHLIYKSSIPKTP